MTMRMFSSLLAALLLAAALLSMAMPAQGADPTTLEVEAPRELALGDEVTISAVLRDGTGAPVPGAAVLLESAGSFLSTDGAVRIGEATTDAQGRAEFGYEARIQGPAVLTASFAGDTRHGPATGSIEISIQGSAQLYTETAGARVPGVGVWLLVGLLGGVWSTYFAVMVFMTLIAREPAHSVPNPEPGVRHE